MRRNGDGIQISRHDLAAEQIGHFGADGLVWHVEYARAAFQFDPFAEQLRNAAGAGRRVREQAGFRFRELQVLLQRVRSDRRMHDHHERGRREVHDGNQFLIEPAARVGMQRIVDRVVDQPVEQRMAVGRCPGRELGCDRAVRARAVVHNDGLADGVAQFRRDLAHAHVGRAAGDASARGCGSAWRERFCASAQPQDTHKKNTATTFFAVMLPSQFASAQGRSVCVC